MSVTRVQMGPGSKRMSDPLLRIAEALERLSPPPQKTPDLTAEAFVWHTGPDRLEPIAHVSRVDLSLLIGIDRAGLGGRKQSGTQTDGLGIRLTRLPGGGFKTVLRVQSGIDKLFASAQHRESLKVFVPVKELVPAQTQHDLGAVRLSVLEGFGIRDDGGGIRNHAQPQAEAEQKVSSQRGTLPK